MRVTLAYLNLKREKAVRIRKKLAEKTHTDIIKCLLWEPNPAKPSQARPGQAKTLGLFVSLEKQSVVAFSVSPEIRSPEPVLMVFFSTFFLFIF